MRLVGYSDRLSAAPGEAIAFMVSSAHATYAADVVRLVHGDPNPLGPGFIVEPVDTPVAGAYAGRVQEIHTGSYVIVADRPALRLTGSGDIYSSEADVLNMALFGQTARQWRESNPEAKGNLRDQANMAQLVVLSNLENLNAHFIRENVPQEERLRRLNQIAIGQMKLLAGEASVKELTEG